MGNASAKLRRNLQRGEEYACLELCEKHAEFRRVLDPNVSYGEAHAHNTPLHYAAKHSMRALKNNTALHYAASSGLMKCVELLVAAGADMSVHNEHKDTPCDAAERAGNTSIAEYLEMRTVFTISPEPIDDDINNADGETATAKEAFTGLREQELIEAKDLLLVETSDMLQVPLFTAEALLSYHDWSREQLWLSWHLDAEACCERSGVLAPASARECNNKIQCVVNAEFQPHGSMKTAHHILVFGCAAPGSTAPVWNCGEMESGSDDDMYETASPCGEGSHILYAWGRDADSLKLPEGVGFKVGGDSDIQFMVVQVHYMHGLDRWSPLHNCKVVSGWKVTEDDKGEDHWQLIGKQDPMKPQMFYPVDASDMVIEEGDVVAARCHMVNDQNKDIPIGSTGADEMCNFYMMYWVEGDGVLSDNTCFSPGPPNYYWKAQGQLNNVPEKEADTL